MKKTTKWVKDFQPTREEFDAAVRLKAVVVVDRFFRGRPTSAVFVANMSYSLVTWLLNNGSIWIMKGEEAS